MPTEQPGSPAKGAATDTEESGVDDNERTNLGPSTETSVDDDTITNLADELKGASVSDSVQDTAARFDALVKDRDALRAEVTHLRQSIEGFRAKHEADLSGLQQQLQETQSEKEQAEDQYQNLLGKVNTVRSQLGERLKADAVHYGCRVS
jgi:DNA repair exonuclease SbcCD ATPase subunit